MILALFSGRTRTHTRPACRHGVAHGTSSYLGSTVLVSIKTALSCRWQLAHLYASSTSSDRECLARTRLASPLDLRSKLTGWCLHRTLFLLILSIKHKLRHAAIPQASPPAPPVELPGPIQPYPTSGVYVAKAHVCEMGLQTNVRQEVSKGSQGVLFFIRFFADKFPFYSRG